jgi:hypothetical protein
MFLLAVLFFVFAFFIAAYLDVRARKIRLMIVYGGYPYLLVACFNALLFTLYALEYLAFILRVSIIMHTQCTIITYKKCILAGYKGSILLFWHFVC